MYLRNADPTDAVWVYVRHSDGPMTLIELADADRIPIGPNEARRMLDYLRDLGVQGGIGHGRVVVVVEDFDGIPIELNNVAAA